MSQVKNRKNELIIEYKRLKKEILKIGYICKGSIVPSYRKCGKPYCKCAKRENEKHGPYWLWTRKVKGKTVSKNLSKKQVKLGKNFILNSKKLDEIIQQMRKLSEEALNIDL